MGLVYPETQHDDHFGDASKASRYKWAGVSNSQGRFEYIDKTRLAIDRTVQRDASNAVSEKNIRSIAAEWDWVACGVLSVSMRDGEYVVFDGQHRLMAAMKREEITTLPCLVFKNATVADEASGFLKINTGKKPVSLFDRHRIALIAGDESAIATERAARSAGIAFSRSPGAGQTKALDWVYRNAEHGQVDVILRAAVDIMRDGPISRRFLEALAYIHRFTSDGINDRLVGILRKHGYKAIEDGMTRSASGFARGGGRVFAVGVLDVANYRLQNRIELLNEPVR